MTEDQMRELLRELHDEPIPADSLARVRRGVADRIQKASWIDRLCAPSVLAALVLAAGCLVFAILHARRPAPIAQPAQPVIASREPATAIQPAPLATAVRKPQRRARPAVKTVRNIESVTAAKPAVLIRIETPDPNVVILLLGDGD